MKCSISIKNCSFKSEELKNCLKENAKHTCLSETQRMHSGKHGACTLPSILSHAEVAQNSQGLLVLSG